MTAHVDWHRDLDICCCGYLLLDRRSNVKLHETVVFIRLFKSADLKLPFIYRQMGNYSVMDSEFVMGFGGSRFFCV